jgi:hypothetical protein
MSGDKLRQFLTMGWAPSRQSGPGVVARRERMCAGAVPCRDAAIRMVS